MYTDEAKYIGYLNVNEIVPPEPPKAATERQPPRKVQFMFYHDSNIQALVLLIDQQLLLLSNNYRYEAAFDFVVLDTFDKSVAYEQQLPILLLEQSALGNLILCTTRQGHVIRNRMKSRKSRGPRLTNGSIIEKLHDSQRTLHFYS
jgi:hypothetical protein